MWDEDEKNWKSALLRVGIDLVEFEFQFLVVLYTHEEVVLQFLK